MKKIYEILEEIKLIRPEISDDLNNRLLNSLETH